MVPGASVGSVIAGGHRPPYSPHPMKPLPRVAALVRLATIAGGLALLVTLAIRPTVDPTGVRAMGPLPACRYDDILTTPRGYGDWSTTLVDTILRVPKTYVPPDLVPVSRAGIAGNGQVRALLIDDLRAMGEAAATANAAIGVVSAYRSYATQQAVFDKWVRLYGRSLALRISARPGHSEHQLGLAIDFRSDPGGSTLPKTWGATPAGKWMLAHAWEYGFVLSYPRGRTGVTCYDYEPWHYRYEGRELAARIHASGLTTREYLWGHFTTTVVPPPTARPPVTPRPSHSPTPAQSTSPSFDPAASAAGSTAPSPAAGPTPAGPGASDTPLPTAAGPSPNASPPPLAQPTAAGVEPGVLAGAGLVIGTIVLGGALIALRRGRSHVGL